MFSSQCLILIAKFIASGLFLVDLHLQFVDDAEQVQLNHVVLEFVVFVSELSLQSLDIELSREEPALCPVVLDVLE